jgi:predicted esterase
MIRLTFRAEMSINILVLHGCNQTQAMCQSVLKDFMAIGTKEGLTFIFTEAKYNHPLGGKTWYSTPLNVSDIGSIKYSTELVGDTLKDIRKLVVEHNIQGLIGFSQGGNVVDTYLRYEQVESLVTEESAAAADVQVTGPIKVAVIFSGYSLVDPVSRKSTVPIMNVTSVADLIVPAGLAPSDYESITSETHDKGHKIPTSKPQLRKIIAFIKSRTQ